MVSSGIDKWYSMVYNVNMLKPHSDTSYIYTLSDPRTNYVRYVGVTVDLKKRMNGYAAGARSRVYTSRQLHPWLNDLMRNDLKPQATIIETCRTKGRRTRELYWIEYYKMAGADLLNFDGVRRAYSLMKLG
jgi:predicted GIY-YIG superfamily endonuclease